MGTVRYSINVTLDGCCDHEAVQADEELHRHAAESLRQADALLFGRVTYEMMRAAFKDPSPDSTDPFAHTIHAARKHVVSRTLHDLDWNAELVRGDLVEAVGRLARESPRGVFVGGVALARSLTELGLIDEYQLLVHPRLVGRGPYLFEGLSSPVDLRLVDRLELASGAVVLRYEPRR
jgi:dihydrofolate reductase